MTKTAVQPDEYVAVRATSYWGEGRAHAADPATAEKSRHTSDIYYRSRCGRKYLYAFGKSFNRVMRLDRCTTCDRLVNGKLDV